MKKWILWLGIFFPLAGIAQKATIVFEETSYNFGTVSESGGKVTHVFTFKNTGNTPLILTNVRTGCGCTIPQWDRQPVAPGAKGNIRVDFDPRNRPGVFVKSITVNSNASNSVLSLTVRGSVKRAPAGAYDGYGYAVGPLRMSAGTVNFGEILNTEQAAKTLDIINAGDRPLTVEARCATPALKVVFSPETLKKGEAGHLQVKYDPRARNEWGFVSDVIELLVNHGEKGSIQVFSNVREDFSAYRGNFEKAPVAVLLETETTLEGLLPNTVYEHSFSLANKGKTELVVRKIKCSSPTVTVSSFKTGLKPGKKEKITLIFKTGAQTSTIALVQLITNDPRNPVVNYRLTGNLK